LFAIRILNPLTEVSENIGIRDPYCALVVPLPIVRLTLGVESIGLSNVTIYSVIALAAHVIAGVRPRLKLALSALLVKLLFKEIHK